jgi:glycine/D-amino acid oxidase-like deaminating enzyme
MQRSRSGFLSSGMIVAPGYPVGGAVWLRDEIGFQPVQYVRGLAQVFVNAGGRVFESSRAVSTGWLPV